MDVALLKLRWRVVLRSLISKRSMEWLRGVRICVLEHRQSLCLRSRLTVCLLCVHATLSGALYLTAKIWALSSYASTMMSEARDSMIISNVHWSCLQMMASTIMWLICWLMRTAIQSRWRSIQALIVVIWWRITNMVIALLSKQPRVYYQSWISRTRWQQR